MGSDYWLCVVGKLLPGCVIAYSVRLVGDCDCRLWLVIFVCRLVIGEWWCVFGCVICDMRFVIGVLWWVTDEW